MTDADRQLLLELFFSAFKANRDFSISQDPPLDCLPEHRLRQHWSLDDGQASSLVESTKQFRSGSGEQVRQANAASLP